jgi:Holliday junction DNA helicase RuvA
LYNSENEREWGIILISYIIGEVAQVSDGTAVLECNNMGYAINISASTMTRLAVGQRAKLYTIMQIRENDVSLIGFLSQEDAKIYEMLVSVSGVGTKAALAIQSALDTSQIILAIITEEADRLTRAQGVGKKLAGRIVLELKDKLKNNEGYEALRPQQSIEHGSGQAKQDAIDALLALGYSRAEALRVVMEITTDGMNTEQIIRQSLKKLVIASK